MPKAPLPPPRGVPKSVSDLYGTDEIDFLLDEIKDLEPACCQLEDIQVEFAEHPPTKPPRTTRLQATTATQAHTSRAHTLAPAASTSSTTPSNSSTAKIYTPSPLRRQENPYHSRYAEDQADDNFILIIPSPQLSAKHNANKKEFRKSSGGFLKRVFRRHKTVEGVEQQRMVQFQTDKELHEIQVLDKKGRKKKTNKNLVVLAGRVDTTEEDDDIVPISIGEHDQEVDQVEDLPCDPPKEDEGDNEKRKKKEVRRLVPLRGFRVSASSSGILQLSPDDERVPPL